MKKLLATLFLFFSPFSIYSQDTIHVPADYATIQAAINAATNGDLVLVAQNTYYENINYKGKAITVASIFALLAMEMICLLMRRQEHTIALMIHLQSTGQRLETFLLHWNAGSVR